MNTKQLARIMKANLTEFRHAENEMILWIDNNYGLYKSRTVADAKAVKDGCPLLSAKFYKALAISAVNSYRKEVSELNLPDTLHASLVHKVSYTLAERAIKGIL